SESEKYIQDSIKKIMRGKTVIAIAHRLSTLKEMDRIIVMSKGRILEQGPPAMLLKKNGKYAKLWKMQTQLRDKDESGK
ncbi:MAG: ABC transporter ATP-binding protein, partial [Lactobacillales bacterium]|nr:ABC transporter ATP-binding protein [Lactobacillales bacterium]